MRRRTSGALLDTNVIIRALLSDHPVQSPRAQALLERAQKGHEHVELEEGVLAESVWVLQRIYKVPRPEIAYRLAGVIGLNGVRGFLPRRALREALAIFGSTTLDIVDCLLDVRARSRNGKVYTFDADFKKLRCSSEEP